MASEKNNARPRGRLNTAVYLLLTVLLGLPLITPLLSWTSVACTHDGHLHYHRVAAMAHAWENGIYLTRWLPDLAFGYGYPFFVYREAAPLYAVLVPFLAGIPLPAASNLFYAVTILLCGIFMFLWVRDLFGPRAGLVSAVAYMAAPYTLVDALIRGNAPESLALPLFPFLLWVGRRWVLHGSVPAFIAGVLGLALLSIGHNISTFIFAPTLLVYLGSLALLDAQRPRPAGEGQQSAIDQRWSAVRGRIARLAVLIALGLGLAIFYTGGALLEMDQVTLEMSTTTRNNDWRFNFASVGEILAPVAAEDPTLVNPPLLFRLGWVPLLLAIIGASGAAWINGHDAQAREQRLHIWLMIAGMAVYVFMALPLSRWLWEAMPLIDFVQFPWRFVGRAALPVAFLAGVPFYYFERLRTATDGTQAMNGRREAGPERFALGRRLAPVMLTAAAIALLIIETIPNLYPRMCMEEPFPTIHTVHHYERVTGLVGVDPEGSYFPRTVRERPVGSPLEADYAAGRTPQRFDLTALPPQATVQDIVYDRFGVTLTVESPEPFTARYLSFAFPGWSVQIDGEPVAIIPEDPSGLITFAVPSGTREIAIRWGATPLRLALVGLSMLSAAGVAVVALGARRRPQATGRRPWKASHLAIGRGEWVAFVVLGIALIALKGYSDRQETLLRRDGTPPIEHAVTLQGGELQLDGFNLSRESVPAGETFDIDMAWRAIASPAVDYQSEISIVGPDGLAWSQKGTERPRVYEDAPNTRQWATGEWGWDSREVRLLSGTPPGVYDIVMTLFDKATLGPVTLLDPATGQAVGPTAVIGQIAVGNPDTPPQFDTQYAVDHALSGSGLRLLGYNQDRAEAAPGDSVLLTLFWQCDDPPLCQRIALELVDEQGNSALEWDLPVVRDGLLDSEWPAHGRLRAQHALQLPASLTSGRYQFVLEGFPLGEIAVAAPERQFDPPPVVHALDVTFSTGDGQSIATLAGIGDSPGTTGCGTAREAGGSCDLNIIWRAEAETADSYHVFVHLVDEAGNLLAQADGIPAGWTRPTTGWLAGEYITDSHTFQLPPDLPAGGLSLRVGLYNPATGERLQAGAADFTTLPLD